MASELGDRDKRFEQVVRFMAASFRESSQNARHHNLFTVPAAPVFPSDNRTLTDFDRANHISYKN
jgi:hypothetical protein